VQHPKDINCGWKNYFQCLYTPSSHHFYDEEFRKSIIPKAKKLKHSAKTTDSSNINITVRDVHMVLKSWKNNKSCGYDGIYFEHIKKGGSVLIDCLKLLFRKMCEFGYCPINMIRGILTTLFKKGNKDKQNPNSYRTISLCSTVLKVYEKIILQKIHELDRIKFHGLGRLSKEPKLPKHCIYGKRVHSFCKEKRCKALYLLLRCISSLRQRGF